MTALPRSLVLNYITRGVTAPRVCTVAFWTQFLMGALWLLSGAGLLAYIAFSSPSVDSIWESILYVLGGSSPGLYSPYGSRLDVLLELLEYFLLDGPGFPASCFLVLGVSYLIPVLPLRRAKRWAAFLSLIAVAFGLLALMMTSVSFASAAIMAVIPVGGPTRDPPSHLLFFLPFVLALLLVLINVDLFGYLRWIFRNPIAEKPLKKFIP
jgi:hypothetical protein